MIKANNQALRELGWYDYEVRAYNKGWTDYELLCDRDELDKRGMTEHEIEVYYQGFDEAALYWANR